MDRIDATDPTPALPNRVEPDAIRRHREPAGTTQSKSNQITKKSLFDRPFSLIRGLHRWP